MDIFNTEAFGNHLTPIGRKFAVSTPVSNIGYFRHKVSRVQLTFSSFNYSFILRGSGTYSYRGQLLQVHAPCVLTQSPGVATDYGPDETWEELYLMYDELHLPRLIAGGLVPDEPLWPIQDSGQLQGHFTALLRTLSSAYIDPYIDRIDALCEMLILESLLGGSRATSTPQVDAVHAIETFVNTHLYSDVDFAALATEHAMQPATFRRGWMREVGVPPARYLMLQRIKEACRLLVETARPIGEIATLLRFEDALYFSRKFRSVTGVTATEYRRRYQANVSPIGLGAYGPGS